MSPESAREIFRLLVPAMESSKHVPPVLELEGGRWTATPFSEVPTDNTPPYTCISYSWGTAFIDNSFFPGQLMSARISAVLATAIDTLHPEAIWLDGACVPGLPDARDACLRSLGRIYASATNVAVVLSSDCAPALRRIKKKSMLDQSSLLALEADDWVTRAWTYQELILSQQVCFIAEDARDAVVIGSDVLNVVGQSLQDYGKTLGKDAFKVGKDFPHLDGLQDLLASWMVSTTVFDALSTMGRRVSTSTADAFNILIGVLDLRSYVIDEEFRENPTESFLKACEAKSNDFSFIYVDGPRSDIAGRGWRPTSPPWTPMLEWHSSGAQPGRLLDTHLELHNMSKLEAGKLSDDARRFIYSWLKLEDAGAQMDLVGLTLERLRMAAFSCSAESIEFEQGLFFPKESRASIADLHVVVAEKVRWVFGAPGLLLRPLQDGRYQFVDVGLFLGPETNEKLSIAVI